MTDKFYDNLYRKTIAKYQRQLNKLTLKFQKEYAVSFFQAQSTKSYWVARQKILNTILDDIKKVGIATTNANLPKVYLDQLGHLKRTTEKRLGKYIEKKGKNIKQLASTKQSRLMLSSIAQDVNASWTAAINQGKKSVAGVFRATQQTLVDDVLLQEGAKQVAALGDINFATKTLQLEFESLAKGNVVITQSVNTAGKTVIRHYKSAYYAEMVSRTQFHELQAFAAKQTTINYGLDLVQVSSHNTTTEICQQYEGKVYSLTGKVKGFPILDQSPPFHVNCGAKGTLVLTNEGWKDLADIKGHELVYSLNIETKIPEWVKIKRKIHDVRDELLEFKSNNVKLRVTDNHRMVFCGDWNYKRDKELQFREAQDIFGYRSGAMYASAEWAGMERVSLDKARFMGWYMSDGSTEKKQNGNYWITVSQQKKTEPIKYPLIKNHIKKIYKGALLEAEYGLRFKDNVLGKEIFSYGKALNKKIPAYIMNGTPKIISAFLETFVLADGHIKNGSLFKGVQFKKTRSFFTSSPVMAGQLCELLTKIGKRPVIKLKKGHNVKFKNGIYFCQDSYIIRECNSQWHTLQNFKYKRIKGKFDVYCLELEKNNTMFWTYKYQGCFWTGNCLHLLFPQSELALQSRGQLNDFKKFSNGTTNKPPVPKSFIPVKDRPKLSVKNEEKLSREIIKFDKMLKNRVDKTKLLNKNTKLFRQNEIEKAALRKKIEGRVLKIRKDGGWQKLGVELI